MASPYYAGVGSRRTPDIILSLMEDVAKKLAEKGLILRSGGAAGADTAFERGVNYWYAFMRKEERPVPKEIFYADDVDKAGQKGVLALNEAQKYHGAWNALSPYAKKLHGRNVFQILGRDLDTPVQFVLCWTPDGCIHHSQRTVYTGGTGTAISIASGHNIPVFNLRRDDHLERVKQFIIS